MVKEFLIATLIVVGGAAISQGAAEIQKVLANGKLTPCPESNHLCEEGQHLYSQNGRFFFCLDVEKTTAQ